MSDNSRLPKVLRVGVIRDGRVIEEQLVDSGEPVTIGSSKNATLHLSADEMPGDAITLFAWRDNKYHLQYDDRVRGRVRVGVDSDALALDALRKEGAVRVGELWAVALPESAKGKLRVGKTTIVFNFVPPPPVAPAAAAAALDFRPRLVRDDDGVFFASLALWGTLGLMFGIWASIAEPIEPETEAITERLLIHPVTITQPPPPIEDPTETEDAIKSDEGEPKEAAPTEVEAEPKPVKEVSPEEAAKQHEEQVASAKESLGEQSALLRAAQISFLGTTGAYGDGVVSRAATGVDDVTSEALAAAQRTGAVDASGSGGSRNKDATIGGNGVRAGEGVTEGTAGNAGSVKEVAAVAPKGTIDIGAVNSGAGSASGYVPVVRANQGSLKYCYETSLKSNPSLKGRVEVSWYIEAGSAIDVMVVSNSTHDADLAKCIVSKIKRWRFQGVEDGEAVVPFTFEPEG